MTERARLPLFTALALVGLLLATAAPGLGEATPRKVAGTWISTLTIPDNPITGPLVLEEIDTFTADGTVVTSSSLPFLELAPGLLVLTSVGHGNWSSIGGGEYQSLQLRFLTDSASGMPAGYVKSTTIFRLEDRDRMSGEFSVQLLDPDKNLLLEIEGGTVEFSLLEENLF